MMWIANMDLRLCLNRGRPYRLSRQSWMTSTIIKASRIWNLIQIDFHPLFSPAWQRSLQKSTVIWNWTTTLGGNARWAALIPRPFKHSTPRVPHIYFCAQPSSFNRLRRQASIVLLSRTTNSPGTLVPFTRYTRHILCSTTSFVFTSDATHWMILPSRRSSLIGIDV